MRRFLGDEGVDAAGFDVEVVSDRPLLGVLRYPRPDTRLPSPSSS